MRIFNKTPLLRDVGYDIRGPITDEANKMIRNGEKILRLNTGNPAEFGFFAPEEIDKALIENIKFSQGYSDSHGIDVAIEAIIKYFKTKGIDGLTYEDVYTGNGVSELINIAVSALLGSGDEVLVPTPDYPLWSAIISLAGGKPVYYKCDEVAEWTPDIKDIKSKITTRTKAIVVINPNNPTGALYPREILEKISNLATEHELIVFADEIYDRLIMDSGEHISMGSISQDHLTITLNGLSKSHMLAGFRAGFMAISGKKEVAKDYISGINMLASMRLCANVLAQSVIKTALDNPNFAQPMLLPGGRIYEQRETIYEAISKTDGLSAVKPKAAFYIFPKISDKVKIDDEKFVLDFLREHKVLMTHGTGFHFPEKNHFRIVFLPEVDELIGLAEKLGEFIGKHNK
jgi:alanine-synthesizing transaminase